MIDKLRGLAISLLVIGGHWLVLLAIGWGAGVLPSRPAESVAPEDGGDAASGGAADAGGARVETDAGPAEADAGERAGAPPPVAPIEPDADDGPPPPPPRRWEACTEDYVRAPILSVGQVLGDDRLEIGFGCAGRQQLLSTVTDALVPVRVASWELDPGPRTDAAELAIHASAPALGDVNGDAKPDVLLAWWLQSPRGGSRSGGVFVALAGRDGTLRAPRRMATTTARRVVLADLDGRGGLDPVVVDRGRPWGEHSPEGSVMLFAGSHRPRERASFDTGMRSRDVVTAQLDGDGIADVVVLGNPLQVLLSDGRAWRYTSHALEVSATGAAAGDLDGDGVDEVVLGERGPRVLRVVDGTPEAPPLDARDLLPVQILDADGDGRAEIVAVSDGRLLLFDRDADDRWQPRALAAGGSRVHDARLVDLDADGDLDVVAATGDRRGFHAITVVPDVLRQPPDAAPAETEAIEDAPVVTRHTAR